MERMTVRSNGWIFPIQGVTFQEALEQLALYEDREEGINYKQDLIIKKMAEFINTFDIDEKVCKQNQINDDCGTEEGDCINCIIEHFRRKL